MFLLNFIDDLYIILSRSSIQSIQDTHAFVYWLPLSCIKWNCSFNFFYKKVVERSSQEVDRIFCVKDSTRRRSRILRDRSSSGVLYGYYYLHLATQIMILTYHYQ